MKKLLSKYAVVMYSNDSATSRLLNSRKECMECGNGGSYDNYLIFDSLKKVKEKYNSLANETPLKKELKHIIDFHEKSFFE